MNGRLPIRPHIGIDARLNSYHQGGITEYTRRLITALAKLDQDSEYQVLQRAGSTLDLIPVNAPNFHATYLRTPSHHRIERTALSAEIALLKLDVLHSPDFIPPRFGVRHKIITVHDLNFLYYPQFQTADSLRYYGGHIRTAVREADHILADSQATKDDLGKLLNVPANKVTVHLLGVDPIFHFFSATEQAKCAATRQRLGLPDSYLLFVGTIEPRKNVTGLLQAYQFLLDRLGDLPPLVLVGRRGWLYESIVQQIAALGDHVHWLETVATSDLPAVYNSALALVLPSFYEGFGLPALEAMACGVPTVVSDRGSLPEVVGDTGVLIDPDRPDSIADGLYRAMADSAFRYQSMTAGQARAASFTWERVALTALAVYKQVVNH